MPSRSRVLPPPSTYFFNKDVMRDFEFPFAKDKTSGKSSVTLFFAYVSFLLAAIVTGYLVYKDAIAGTVSALMLFFGCLLMYRLRRLDSFSIDLDDKQISVNSNGSSNEK